MQCFVHSSAPAVALCKHCSKGLCSACAVDSGYGMTCGGACEKEVHSLRDALQRSKTVYTKTATIYLRTAFLYGAFAFVFLGLIVYFRATMPVEVKFLLGGGGAVFLLGALFNVVNAWKMRKISVDSGR